jgi:hypothetical protein
VGWLSNLVRGSPLARWPTQGNHEDQIRTIYHKLDTTGARTRFAVPAGSGASDRPSGVAYYWLLGQSTTAMPSPTSLKPKTRNRTAMMAALWFEAQVFQPSSVAAARWPPAR